MPALQCLGAEQFPRGHAATERSKTPLLQWRRPLLGSRLAGAFDCSGTRAPASSSRTPQNSPQIAGSQRARQLFVECREHSPHLYVIGGTQEPRRESARSSSLWSRRCRQARALSRAREGVAPCSKQQSESPIPDCSNEVMFCRSTAHSLPEISLHLESGHARPFRDLIDENPYCFCSSSTVLWAAVSFARSRRSSRFRMLARPCLVPAASLPPSPQRLRAVRSRTQSPTPSASGVRLQHGLRPGTGTAAAHV